MATVSHLLATAALAAGVASPAVAQHDIDALRLALDLGMLIASEEPCGLSFSEAAIRQFIDTNVPPDALLGFANDLNTSILGAGYDLRDQSDSARVAHCHSVALAARHNGLVE